MKKTINALIPLLLLFSQSMNTRAQERKLLCQLVENHAYSELTNDRKNPYDNGYSEQRYDYVLDTFIDEFSPDTGNQLNIQRDWTDGAVNAWAWRIGQEYWLEVPGGMSRYHLISEEGFISTLCHELGHLLGGSPHSHEISYEGQADYYGHMKCLERIFKRLNLDRSDSSELSCAGEFCQARLEGAKSLSSYYASLENSPFPSLITPDQSQVTTTLRSHPKAQCRFDTMVAAMKCPNRTPFSYLEPHSGSCQEEVSQRPKCWYSF
ncbi:MAG: hypothetical protein CME60_05450 [Halobacteriovoraceae bacterium]|nr:hypothetical protein [Halobacteriovoraceae bacterium]